MEKKDKLMKIDFSTKTLIVMVMIKTKIKTYKDNITTNFCNKIESKKYRKKKYCINVYP